jgi:uncharacterized protein YbjQ (UPF0145 family)
MHNFLYNIIIMMCALVMLSACTPWSHSKVKGVEDSVTIAASKMEQTSAQDIVITETDISDRNYKVLGEIEVTVSKYTLFNRNPTQEDVNEELRKEAAEMGADAVILVRYGTVGVSLVSWGSLNGKGRAIVFLD